MKSILGRLIIVIILTLIVIFIPYLTGKCIISYQLKKEVVPTGYIDYLFMYCIGSAAIYLSIIVIFVIVGMITKFGYDIYMYIVKGE